MSLRDEIEAHIGERRLFRLPALLGASGPTRMMIVASDIYKNVQPTAWPHNRTGERLGRLRGTLDRFTNNDRVAIALQPKNKPPATFLARLTPVTNEVWDIRSTDPRPGIRVLGRFSERDTFVALVWDFHENVIGRADWTHFGERCLQCWNNLFATLPPHQGTSANDYLSSNFISV